MDDDEAARLQIGRTIDEKYRLLGLLGSGGMGAVYLAEHVFTMRRVALKRMHPEIARSKQAAQRFMRESQAPSAIGHPGIVQVLDGGRDADGSLYLVLELLEGLSLQEALEQEALDARGVAQIGRELLAALDAAHRKGFVHRDIKPHNVFLAQDGQAGVVVKLLDFGIASLRGLDASANLTKTGAVLGTPTYMSPEQARGDRVDARSDLWSVGALLYRALAGTTPYTGDTDVALIVSIVTQQHVPLSEVCPSLPSGLLDVVERALRKAPDERFESAAAMGAALAAVRFEDSPASAGSLPVHASRRAAAARERAEPDRAATRLASPSAATVMSESAQADRAATGAASPGRARATDRPSMTRPEATVSRRGGPVRPLPAADRLGPSGAQAGEAQAAQPASLFGMRHPGARDQPTLQDSVSLTRREQLHRPDAEQPIGARDAAASDGGGAARTSDPERSEARGLARGATSRVVGAAGAGAAAPRSEVWSAPAPARRPIMLGASIVAAALALGLAGFTLQAQLNDIRGALSQLTAADRVAPPSDIGGGGPTRPALDLMRQAEPTTPPASGPESLRSDLRARDPIDDARARAELRHGERPGPAGLGSGAPSALDNAAAAAPPVGSFPEALSTQHLAAALSQRQPELERCLQEAMVDEMLAGGARAEPFRLDVALHVEASGRVADVEVSGRAPQKLTGCLRARLLTLELPRAAGPTLFHYPLVLTPNIVGR